MLGPVALGSALLGVVAGMLIAHAGDIGPDWFKPEVLGSIVGAFLAAMIGLGGAAWVHFAGIRERKKEAQEAARRASGKVFGSMLELYGYFSLFDSELDRAVVAGNIQPHLIVGIRDSVSATAAELSVFADDPAVHHHFTAQAKNIARGSPKLPQAIEFPEAVLEGIPPNGTIPINPTDRHVFEQIRDPVKRASKLMMGFLIRIEETYQIMEVPRSEVQERIDAEIEKIRDSLSPAWV